MKRGNSTPYFQTLVAVTALLLSIAAIYWRIARIDPTLINYMALVGISAILIIEIYRILQ